MKRVKKKKFQINDGRNNGQINIIFLPSLVLARDYELVSPLSGCMRVTWRSRLFLYGVLNLQFKNGQLKLESEV